MAWRAGSGLEREVGCVSRGNIGESAVLTY